MVRVLKKKIVIYSAKIIKEVWQHETSTYPESVFDINSPAKVQILRIHSISEKHVLLCDITSVTPQ